MLNLDLLIEKFQIYYKDYHQIGYINIFLNEIYNKVFKFIIFLVFIS